MKKVVIIFGLLFVTTYSLLAASLISLAGYDENFKIKKEIWICTSVAFPVDISYDVFNVDFKTITAKRSGYFIQVKPGVHTDASKLPSGEATIENPAKGVFNTVGKPAGVYEYVFVSNDDGFCGMYSGEQAIVRVYLAPQLTSFPVLTNICPASAADGQSVISVNFDDFIPAEIRKFTEQMGWKFSYTNNNIPVSMPVKAGLSNDATSHVGNNIYRYTINDSEGNFANMYKEMQKSPYYCPSDKEYLNPGVYTVPPRIPEDSAYIMHTVKIRDEYVIPDKKISFCKDLVIPILSTNLFSYTGSSVPGGSWSIAKMGDFSQENYPDIFVLIKDWFITLAAVNGNVEIKVEELKKYVESTGYDIYEIMFKYTYKANCSSVDAFAYLTLDFKDGAIKQTFEKSTTLPPICRSSVSGEVELSSLFGFSAPLSSGIWFRENSKLEKEEMSYGMVNISNMKNDSIYVFYYNANSAAGPICQDATSTKFNLKIEKGLELADGAVQICKSQFINGVTLDLSKYIPGLDLNKISSDQITWYDEKDVLVPNGQATLTATEAQATNDSTYLTQFHYTIDKNDACGPYKGNLQVSTIDSIGGTQERNLQICYTDQYATNVNLFQILGLANAKGKFHLDGNPLNQNNVVIPLSDADNKEIENTGIMNAYKIFVEAYNYSQNETVTYRFRYLRDNDDEQEVVCISEEVYIIITITKDVKFEK
ncbi:MAG: hypothetical protein LBS55_01610 [Prevotellaceae bacterium]|jgi:hypothetical protein|nr:hypothetical protein [Prevotellaceae bacterium]